MSTKPRTLFELLSDNDERPHLLLAMDGKLDDAGRLAYAKLLENRDPSRAEWIRLEVQLHNKATADTTIHQRFRTLGGAAGYDFLRVMRRDDILNCAKGASEPRSVRFAFICEKRWDVLLPTESANERHCNACNSRVYHCSTVREAEEHAHAGHCIAVSSLLVDKAAGGGYFNAVGRPNPVRDWATKLFPED